jgi:guanylate kinase
MLEHKLVYQNWYGTSTSHLNHLQALGKIPILDVDIEGMLEIRRKIDCEVLCLMPPSWELLQSRLTGRKSESLVNMKNRMEENVQQVSKMLKLSGTPGIYFVTNYQYQLATFGIEKWLSSHFQQFRQAKLHNEPSQLRESTQALQ